MRSLLKPLVMSTGLVFPVGSHAMGPFDAICKVLFKVADAGKSFVQKKLPAGGLEKHLPHQAPKVADEAKSRGLLTFRRRSSDFPNTNQSFEILVADDQIRIHGGITLLDGNFKYVDDYRNMFARAIEDAITKTRGHDPTFAVEIKETSSSVPRGLTNLYDSATEQALVTIDLMLDNASPAGRSYFTQALVDALKATPAAN